MYNFEKINKEIGSKEAKTYQPEIRSTPDNVIIGDYMTIFIPNET